ncbi:LacI family transcriptional regulator [Nocardiopsis sp. Huas11]|uniref:LacI family DNA-binding transcriptional regulator n=1 Tax=Nocardiopsis sp. Huas11 TaxID=2183912 RepID=UPI000F1B3352|nr:LacI family DNA-binding transcriptional regulator [Nocardiopsis sp. Huas11]RKS10300.1 LacI family transcriptional regulator [Nocardiopsis sp. Huas11]
MTGDAVSEQSRAAPTLEMVATLAGVSRATASRAINGATTVDPDLVAAVNKAVNALNYVPNRAARSLVTKRAQAVTLVVPESTTKVFADPFFGSVVEGMSQYLSGVEYTLNMVISSETNPAQTRRYLMGSNVDGVLVVSHHMGDLSWTTLDSSLPIVFAGRPLIGEKTRHYIEVDNEQGAARGTQHLVSRGRRNIATIAGPQDMPPGIDRLRGWRRALKEAGLPDNAVEIGDFTIASGAETMRRLLDRNQPIDGLFAANDQMAAGAYSVLQARGLRIPEDIAVVGFDDGEIASALVPALTTVHHPIVQMGQRMAEMLVGLIEGKPTDRVVRLTSSLVIRDSA